MNKIKIIAYFFCILGSIIGVFLVISKIFSIDLFQNGDHEIKAKEEALVSGINLNNLEIKGLDGEIVLYLNGIQGVKVIRYKLSSGRERLITNLTGSLLEYYSYGKINYMDGNIYWVRYKESNDELVFIDLSKTTPNESVIYSSGQGKRIIGVQIFSKDEIYFTQFLKNENNIYQYELQQLKGGKSTLIYKDEESQIKVVTGKDEKDKLIVQDFNEATNSLENACFRLEDLSKEVYCTAIKEIDYSFETREADDKGFIMGDTGYIDIVDKKDKITRLLEGGIDEHFKEMLLSGKDVYLISGQIESSFLDGEINYGVFTPVALEKIGIDGGNRTKLKVLPTSSDVQIFEVTKEYVLLGISEKGTNKLETRPLNVWLYKFDTGELVQLTDIECGLDSYCEAIYLSKF